jgi:hypothetical protein
LIHINVLSTVVNEMQKTRPDGRSLGGVPHDISSQYADATGLKMIIMVRTEKAASHFYLRAEMGKNIRRNQSEVDADYEKAAHLAALAVPYRHARLSAMKLAGDPNNSMRIKDDATVEEIRAELMKHMMILIDGGLIDLEALPLPNRGIANQPNG